MDEQVPIEKHVIELLQRIFGPSVKITREASVENLQRWDSLKHIEILLELEEEFGLEISVEDGANLFSLSAITEFVSRLKS